MIGPLLIGLSQPVQIVPMDASVSDIVNIAAIAAYEFDPRRARHADTGRRRRCGASGHPDRRRPDRATAAGLTAGGSCGMFRLQNKA